MFREAILEGSATSSARLLMLGGWIVVLGAWLVAGVAIVTRVVAFQDVAGWLDWGRDILPWAASGYALNRVGSAIESRGTAPPSPPMTRTRTVTEEETVTPTEPAEEPVEEGLDPPPMGGVDG